jgi:hypothetical protein
VRGRPIRVLKSPLLFNGPPLPRVEFNVPGVDASARNPPPVTRGQAKLIRNLISSQAWSYACCAISGIDRREYRP